MERQTQNQGRKKNKNYAKNLTTNKQSIKETRIVVQNVLTMRRRLPFRQSANQPAKSTTTAALH